MFGSKSLYWLIIIIIIMSYFSWVATSLRLLLRPPVSHTLAHTHNLIKLNQFKLFSGYVCSSNQVGGRGWVQGKKLGNGVQVEWCLLLNA